MRTKGADMQPQDTYVNRNGKTIEVYVIDAGSLREALNKIPGDFLIYYHNEDQGTFTIEIARTF
jgi:hypothetical protein